MKFYAFEATVFSKRDVTVREVQSRFDSQFAVDVVESGSLPSAIRQFNNRNTKMAFGRTSPMYTVINQGNRREQTK